MKLIDNAFSIYGMTIVFCIAGLFVVSAAAGLGQTVSLLPFWASLIASVGFLLSMYDAFRSGRFDHLGGLVSLCVMVFITFEAVDLLATQPDFVQLGDSKKMKVILTWGLVCSLVIHGSYSIVRPLLKKRFAENNLMPSK